MNRTKVVKAIKANRDPSIPYQKNSYMDNASAAIEALEEIASQDNIEALRVAIVVLSKNEFAIVAEQLAKLRGVMISVQIPKEVFYAYPMTMSRHFSHYRDKYFGGNVPNKDDPGIRIYDTEKDDFGCGWTKFTGPKELVEFLRENNVPIKVIE